MTRPICDECHAPLNAVFVPGEYWRYEGCGYCERAERMQVFISEGTALKFKAKKALRIGDIPDNAAGYEYVEITEAMVPRFRYVGAVHWVDSDIGAVAVFKELTTGVLYGQPY